MNSRSTGFLEMPEGQEIGVSDWIRLDQAAIDAFGVLTRDHDPQHMDPRWAREHGPFDGTILFGFQTVAMLSHLLRSAIGYTPGDTSGGMFLNYGFDRLRLIAPVPVDRRFRGRFVSGPVREDAGGRRIKTIRVTVEVEGEDRPALAADWLTAWLPPDDAGGVTLRS